MSPAPTIRRRTPGEEGGLARDLLAGRGRAEDLYPRRALNAGSSSRERSEARLEAGAFGTTTDAARERLQRILDGDGWLVTTGQQPVLFLGPLYVLYKALAAVQLADEVREATGRPALACFWVASDDHDWEEVGCTRLLDGDNRLRTLRLDPPDGWSGRSAGRAPLPAGTDDHLEGLSDILPDSDFVDTYLELIRDAYRAGRRVSEAFGRALGDVLEPRPLAWLDAGSAAVEEAAAPALRRALEDAEGGEAALREGTERVRAAGYEPRIPNLDGGTHVFFDTGEARVRIYRAEGEAFRLGRDGRRVEAADLLAELDREPGRFSPNVSLRPVLESWLLPVAYTVLGPGELAYWAQLPPLFERRAVSMPAVRPRPSWTVVEAKVEKVLRKVDAPPEDFRDGGEALVRRAVARSRPGEVESALTRLRRAIQTATEELESAVRHELPGIRSSVGKARSEMFAVASELDRAVDDRVEERREVVVRQIRKAAAHLYPDGAPQERVINPLYYLARYGHDFLNAVEEAGRDRPLRPWPGTGG